MVPEKKKIPLWIILSGAVLSGYAGYLLNGAWEPGIRPDEFLLSFNRVCKEPFSNYYSETTFQAVAVALMGQARGISCRGRNLVRQGLKIHGQ